MMIDPNPGQFKMLGEYRTIEWTDKQSSSGEDPENPVAWLLYRDISPVPAPPALLLFGTGLLGLIGFSKRKAAMLKAA
jgi:hypothetical protein